MDIFGKALSDYYSGMDFSLYFKIGDNRFEIDKSHYFRKHESEFSKVELNSYNSCKGNILDVGSGTCYYHHLVTGNITGIDNSEHLVNVAKSIGACCIKGDIFKYTSTNQFDTILFFGNSLGLGGNLNNTKKLLNKIKTLINKNGYILAVQKEIVGSFDSFPIILEYNGAAQQIEWISFNSGFILNLSNNLGFKGEILLQNDVHYLLKLSLKRFSS